jgi:hypothetical protein
MATAEALREMTIIVVGGANDAPGFKIVPDGHGGFKIVPVPGWDPQQMLELQQAVKIIAAAGRIKHERISHEILQSATRLVASELRGAIGKQQGDAPVVIALG